MLAILRAMPLRGRILLKIALSLFNRGFAMNQLTEMERFILSGGNEMIWAIRPTGQVLVLGGYEGLSTLQYARTSQKVISLEPVESFRQLMVSRTRNLNNVECLDFAAAEKSGKMTLTLGADGTSAVRDVGNSRVTVESRDVAEVVSEYGPFELMECNIEGGEYPVLDRLCGSGKIAQIEKVLVQFHVNGAESEENLIRARTMLAETHLRLWSFEWVWELWVRKSEAILP